MRRLLLLCSILVMTLAGTSPAGAQETAVRFEISTVADTSFTFRLGRHEWVSRGQRGIAVDPRRRDVMVARFHVVSVADGVATAVITGQTTTIGSEHVALINQPEPRWYARLSFWAGAGLGLIVGALAGAGL